MHACYEAYATNHSITIKPEPNGDRDFPSPVLGDTDSCPTLPRTLEMSKEGSRSRPWGVRMPTFLASKKENDEVRS